MFWPSIVLSARSRDSTPKSSNVTHVRPLQELSTVSVHAQRHIEDRCSNRCVRDVCCLATIAYSLFIVEVLFCETVDTCVEYHISVLDEMTFDGYFAGKASVCSYTKRYYCPTCHTNEDSIIPAKIVYNWDFAKYKGKYSLMGALVLCYVELAGLARTRLH